MGRAVSAGRRRFLQGSLALAGLGLVAGCAAVSQPPRTARQARVAVLSPAAIDPSPEGTAFRQGLATLGYVEGENLVVFRRFSNLKEGLAVAAAEVLDLTVDVIVAVETQVIRAVKEATGTVPIVMAAGRNPIEYGLVASLARPGGNVTGLTSLATALSGKRLDLLREVIPGVRHVAALLNSDDPASALDWRVIQEAARHLALRLQPLELRTPTDIPAVFEAVIREQAEALIVLMGPYSFVCGCDPKAIVDFAARNRLPAMYETREFVDAGGLISFGPNRPDMFRRAATYVDKILKGAKPAELPVEQPREFDFVINLKTADALGLTIPPSVLQQATEIIQ